MRELIHKALEAPSMREGLVFFYEYLKERYQVDQFKVYLLSGNKSFLVPRYLFGKTYSLGPISLTEEGSIVVHAYKKNEFLWVSHVPQSEYSRNVLLKKQGVNAFLVLPFLNQGVVNVEFYRTLPEVLDEKLLIELKAFLAILLNRFYLGEIQEEIKRSLNDIEKQITFSQKLSYLGQLASSLAHEIKNPLTTINLLIHNLLEGIAEGSMEHEDLTVIKEEIERIERLLSDFLNFAKPGQAKMEKLNMQTVFRKTFHIIKPHIKKKQIDIEAHFLDNSHIMADKDQVQQILLNLILNAIEVVPAQSGKITCYAEKTLKKGAEYYNFRVEDNGPGIRTEALSQIFEPFFSESGHGTGLGLSIVHRLMDNQRGFIEAYNLLHGGACFSLFFPLDLGVEG